MERRVCVTGASGYIASWLVKLLLQRDYTVHATVRSLKDPAKTEHLVCMDGAKERLRLFEANLMEESSFDSAIHGCIGVFHVASPVIFNSPNPQEDIIDPAVKGTLNVLNSCAKTGSVKRVIFTSSTAAVVFGSKPLTNQTIVDETWFSTPEGCEAIPHAKWYLLSKTWAEEGAWKFAKEKGIDMISINPAAVIGPLSHPTSLNYSAALLLDFVNEPDKHPNLASGWVHVKDVAEAHIRAFENPSASGRYILSENVAYYSEIVNILQDLYPTLNISNKWDEKVGAAYSCSKEKATSLGLKYIPMRDALKETIQSLADNKFINV